MAKKRIYTDLERSKILEEVKEVGNIAAVAKKNDIPVGTIHTWIRPKKSIKVSQSSEQEIKLLKNKLSDAELENKILKELLKKTYQVWDAR